MNAQLLPEGWTLPRVREVTMCPDADFGDLSTPVYWEGQDERLSVTTVLVFGELAIVRESDGDWSMGTLMDDEITLWGGYGENFEYALGGL